MDQEGRPAVPYRFCSDEISDLDPTCMLYDAGADAYESLQSINDSYWNYYIFRSGGADRSNGMHNHTFAMAVLNNSLAILKQKPAKHVLVPDRV